MEFTNGTVQEFILLGFEVGQLQRLLLLVFFTLLYMLAMAENITIITLVVLDIHLSRLPMYILLRNFSWLEICYVNTTMPRMLLDLALSNKIISFGSCFLQFYVFCSLGSTECFFLSSMALDRYLAICHPLRYPQIMSPNFCYVLVTASWVLGFLASIVPVTLISMMSYCGPNVIDHFLCDPGPIMALACPPLPKAPIISLIFINVLVILGNIVFTVLSYGSVIITLMKNSSKGNRGKSFSTISFHLLVVTLFYGPLAGIYIKPREADSNVTKIVTLCYTAITPFLNPLIYCLRNDQVKEALFRLWRRKAVFLKSKIDSAKKRKGTGNI
ncbi:PREDICTED: olfactory receptor 11H6-like [Gekko japonicus]|uniref:Olfactory receptor n=1 Tax=Gekko japonicus TaxID=146911 RepID=A0ABM1KNY2_GEKJA|nr:PREDICTED: olfactory receptor 11H6-like [Gekko japonicus]